MTRTTNLPKLLLAAVFAALLLAPASPAAADCIPVTVPAVIDEPGSYCLVEDFEGPLDRQTAIAIESDHVILDLQGHLIRNTSLPEEGRLGQGVGAWERSHIVVRNGSIAGFWEGVSLGQEFGGVQSSVNHLVEDLRVYDCQRMGIGVGGSESVIRNNVVQNIHGIGIESEVSGLFISGNRHRVIGNDVSRITGENPSRWGIRLLEGLHSVVIGNRLTATRNGILMDKTDSVYRDNLVVEIASGNAAYSGGIDAGGNLSY